MIDTIDIYNGAIVLLAAIERNPQLIDPRDISACVSRALAVRQEVLERVTAGNESSAA